MKALSWLREAFHDADHPPLQPCPHQLETLRLRSQLARITVERNEAREALADLQQRLAAWCPNFVSILRLTREES